MADKYPVLNPFQDLENNNLVYGTNGPYPVDGFKPSEARIAYLQEKGHIGDKMPKVFDDDDTVDDIKAELDNRGVDYGAKAKKDELLKLVNEKVEDDEEEPEEE